MADWELVGYLDLELIILYSKKGDFILKHLAKITYIVFFILVPLSAAAQSNSSQSISNNQNENQSVQDKNKNININSNNEPNQSHEQKRLKLPMEKRRFPPELTQNVIEPLPVGEERNESLWGIGFKAGAVFGPEYIQRLFLDGGTDVTGAAISVQATYRWRNNFDIVFNFGWFDYSFDGEELYFAAGDRNDPEFLSNSLSLLVLGVDFIWHHYFNKWLSLYYGAGIGMGIVLGEIVRTEATPPHSYPYADPLEEPQDGYVHCSREHVGTTYCEDPSDPYAPEIAFYNDKETRIPPVLPWFNLLIGMQFKVHRNVSIQAEGGFGIGWIGRVGLMFWF